VTQIVRFRSGGGEVHVGVAQAARISALGPTYPTLGSLLRLPTSELRSAVEQARPSHNESGSTMLLAPIDGQTEVWAAGVTYRRSAEARLEESGTPDIYTRVYAAERPELFFKANPRRVTGPDQPIAVRADSSWDVPEPELALVVNAHAEIVGYTIANDVSSRSIEGENPLYLPQAKVYAGCCSIGPGITPAWEVADAYALGIRLRILRAGQLHWRGESSTRELKRPYEELVSYLFREDEFPEGVILSTGTALVPESPFTLEAGDVVEIEIDQLGTLRNPVVRGRLGLAP
jgi:2-dehydro-3-deoxy-D-arabinonate dehydratase